MKFNAEVDCTPEELRQFLGLPDVKPMQTAVLAKIEKQALDAVDASSPDALFRMWMPAVGQLSEQFKGMMNVFMSSATRKKD